MNNLYLNTQSSLLAYINTTAATLQTLFGNVVTPVNFDSHADLSTLPPGDIIAMEGLAMSSVDDQQALAQVSVVFTFATENDSNNMQLTKYISYLFDLMQPGKTGIPFLDESTGDVLGTTVLFGQTQLMPADKASSTKAYQSLGIQFAILAYEA